MAGYEPFDDRFSQKPSIARKPLGPLVRKRVAAGICLLLGVALFVASIVKTRTATPRKAIVARIGEPLPCLPVVDGSGNRVDATKAAPGRKAMIWFFSPSCQVCQKELVNIQPFPRSLYLIMINVGGTVGLEKFERMASEHGVLYFDRDGTFNRSFPMAGIPVVLLIDEHGVLRAGLVGTRSQSAAQQKIQTFVQSSE